MAKIDINVEIQDIKMMYNAFIYIIWYQKRKYACVRFKGIVSANMNIFLQELEDKIDITPTSVCICIRSYSTASRQLA